MKKALLIFGGIALVAGGTWAVWRYVVVPRQKFSFNKIDWLNKTVSFSTPMGSDSVIFSDLKAPMTAPKKSNTGNWNVHMQPGVESIIFTLKRGSTVLDVQKVDFKNQIVIPMTS